MKNKKRFRVIENKARQRAKPGGKVTAQYVRAVWREYEDEVRQMENICPQLNALIDDLFHRDLYAIGSEPWSDVAILQYCLSAARMQFFEMKAQFAGNKIRGLK